MFRITHSLLSAWDYATGDRAGDDSLTEFIKTLKREPKERTKAMQAGIDFEDAVTFYSVHGRLEHDNYPETERRAIIRFGEKVRWAAPQVRAESKMTIGGMDFLLVGVADYLKAGIIYDTKRIGMYEYGKYVGNTQHPMYFELFPEAVRFSYLIFDGYNCYQEDYRRGDFAPIQDHIAAFIRDMKEVGLLEIYKQNWSVQ